MNHWRSNSRKVDRKITYGHFWRGILHIPPPLEICTKTQIFIFSANKPSIRGMAPGSARVLTSGFFVQILLTRTHWGVGMPGWISRLVLIHYPNSSRSHRNTWEQFLSRFNHVFQFCNLLGNWYQHIPVGVLHSVNPSSQSRTVCLGTVLVPITFPQHQ